MAATIQTHQDKQLDQSQRLLLYSQIQSLCTQSHADTRDPQSSSHLQRNTTQAAQHHAARDITRRRDTENLAQGVVSIMKTSEDVIDKARKLSMFHHPDRQDTTCDGTKISDTFLAMYDYLHVWYPFERFCTVFWRFFLFRRAVWTDVLAWSNPFESSGFFDCSRAMGWAFI